MKLPFKQLRNHHSDVMVFCEYQLNFVKISYSLCEKYGVFYIFCCICQPEYSKIRTRKNSVFGHFSRSDCAAELQNHTHQKKNLSKFIKKTVQNGQDPLNSKNDTEKTLKFCRYNNIDFIKKHYVALYLNMIYTYICTILIIVIYVHTDDLQ